MKCPACENDVSPGRLVCPRCGTELPSAGEPPGSEPRFATPPPAGSGGAPNPATEPLPSPVWDAPPDDPGADPRGPAQTMPEFGEPAPRPPAPPVPELGERAPYPRPLEREYPLQQPYGPAPGAPPPGWHQAAGPDPAAPSWAPPPGPGPEGWNQDGRPYEEPPGGRTGPNRKVLLVGGIAAAAVLLGGGLVYALTQGTEHPTRTSGGQAGADGAAQQAGAVNEILKTGRTARGHLPAPLKTCDDVSAGVPGFQQVVRDRQQELSRSKGLQVDRLRDGARLRQSMISAYQSSLAADQAYLAWAQEVRDRGCGTRFAPLTAHYKTAVSANHKAGTAKRQLVALWKPIAGRNGLPTYAWNRI